MNQNNKNKTHNNFLNDKEKIKKHEKTVLIMRIFGITLLVTGIILSIIGFSTFASGSVSSMVFLFLGFPMFGFGLSLTTQSFSKNINRFQMMQKADINRDYMNFIVDGSKENIKDIHDELKDDVLCVNCGAHNSINSKYCKSCGASLRKVCPNCKHENDANSKFCVECGTKLD